MAELMEDGCAMLGFVAWVNPAKVHRRLWRLCLSIGTANCPNAGPELFRFKADENVIRLRGVVGEFKIGLLAPLFGKILDF